MDNGQIQLTFNKWGRLKMINGSVFRQGLAWYEGFSGTDHTPPSGAYLFRPTELRPNPVGWNAKETRVVKGPLVQEVHQTSGWISQVIRLYKGQPEVEFEWVVGPIPVGDNRGKEVVVLYEVPGLATNGTFLTDSNGRQMVRRRRDVRQTWKLNSTEPVSQNYYPGENFF